MNNHIFGERLCFYMEKNSLTIEELSEKLDISPRQLSRYRNGNVKNISLEMLLKFSKALNISVDELIH